ncbi:MAG TPA: beta-N-acetylhexosaminidase [Polyangiaceae bacterium]|nr:beta-N-acetylhexosaminidase [Polyangiaceae bacterium]
MTPAPATAQLCGRLLVGAFDGPTLPPTYARALAEGRRGGAILFRRNMPELGPLHELCRAVVRAAEPSGEPPWLGLDEEGGRVRRLPAPALALPPARRLGAPGLEALAERAGDALGAQLAALGFNIDFAPVLDVDTNPKNPVIGDRAFDTEPGPVANAALSFYRGLARHVLGCGKHFPGHGDTHLDSHVDLPSIGHDRGRLEAVELAPFRAAVEAGIDALMTAHIVVRSFDADRPATLSPALCAGLLRRSMGFRGVLFSDDLSMKAVSARYEPGEAAVLAVAAGCDVLLVCGPDETQERALEALAREASSSDAFRARCAEARARALAALSRRPPRPADGEAELRRAFEGEALDDLRRELARLEAGGAP